MGAQSVRQPLSRERIAETAIRLVDEQGFEALSMRRLGAELGVEGMAIYRHFPNKEALLGAVAVVFYASIDYRPPERASWQDKLRHTARALRQSMCAHPNLMPLLALKRPPEASHDWLGMLEVRLAALAEAGLGPRESLAAYHALESYVLGYANFEVRHSGDDLDSGWEQLTRALDGGDFPATERALPYYAAVDWDEEFEAGLDTVIAGIERRYR